MIIFLHRHQKLTFRRMSTPQCHEINVMTFDTECHEICFVGRKTNVMTLKSCDLENVMTFIFSGTGSWCMIYVPVTLPCETKQALMRKIGKLMNANEVSSFTLCAIQPKPVIYDIMQDTKMSLACYPAEGMATHSLMVLIYLSQKLDYQDACAPTSRPNC